MNEFSIETLVATTNQTDDSLIERMNIQTNAIIGNQIVNDTMTVQESIRYYYENGHRIGWLTFKEKGVGLNRNNCLMRATADIVVFADDDMVFKNGYEEIVRAFFNDNPKADVIIFNLDEEKKSKRYKNQKNHYTKKIGYGASRIACRRDVIFKRGIFFNLCFGGGAPYACGEDTMFLAECIKHNLKIFAVTESIAVLKDSKSTWFNGYNEQYFYDKGFLYASTGISLVYLRILKNSWQYTKQCKVLTFKSILANQIRGVKDFKRKTWHK